MTRRAPLVAPVPALTLSALGGLVLSLAFPEPGWWWCAPLGLAGLLLPLVGRSRSGALAVGLVGGAAFYGALVRWATLFLGPVPYTALVVLMAAWMALGGLLIAWAYAWLPRRWPGRCGRFAALPLAVGGLWTAREVAAGSVPYGGFPWGRVAQSQSASPFSDLVSWLGTSGLTFVIVTLTALAVEVARAAVEGRADTVAALARAASTRAARRTDAGVRAAGAVAAACAVALLAAVPAFGTAPAGTLRVGAVQGDTPEAGYFLRGEPGDVLAGHLAASEALRGADVDVVLWPEGSVDVSPVFRASVAVALTNLSDELDAPLVANTVTVTHGATEADVEYFNTQFVWAAGGGFADTVDKQRPVPFGEYIPDRDVWYALAPDLVGLIQRGYTPGTGPAVLDVAGVRAGTFICYDIVDDAVVRDAVDAGATVLFAPTNNADFGDTSELPQQLAIARLRAMETGRPVVQVSTVGDSAVYAADGSELAALPSYEPGVMVVDVPLREGLTPAVVAGRSLEWLVAGLGLALLVGAVSRPSGRGERAASAGAPRG